MLLVVMSRLWAQDGTGRVDTDCGISRVSSKRDQREIGHICDSLCDCVSRPALTRAKTSILCNLPCQRHKADLIVVSRCEWIVSSGQGSLTSYRKQ